MPTSTLLFAQRATVFAGILLLAGCAGSADVYEKHVRTEDANPADVVLTLDVAFAQAPDYDPKTNVYGGPAKPGSSRQATPERVEYSGYPSIDVPFYQKGIGFDLGVVGDPRALLALPYPSPATRTTSAHLQIFGVRQDATHYRFVVLPRQGWNSYQSFQVSFAVNGRREGMTFAYSDKLVCDSAFDVTTPTYGFGMSVAASFPGGKPGCLKACDARPGYPGYCAFGADVASVLAK
ncbi:hypothetical protein [Achromobacter kerstersii]|uniref:hypothetical protein n=1 Tax=Achromobacter kerstersii TaxID=1353890 RepID=UPI0006C54438|nr:hypothetical protein [Achromobacter kerstersii]CUJ67774.1 Uncharacterised protein [Achromobacter kerstersii]